MFVETSFFLFLNFLIAGTVAIPKAVNNSLIQSSIDSSSFGLHEKEQDENKTKAPNSEHLRETGVKITKERNQEYGNRTEEAKNEKELVLFKDPDDLIVVLPLKNLEGKQQGTMKLALSEVMLNKMNFTQDEVRTAWVNISDENSPEVVIGHWSLPLSKTPRTYYWFGDPINASKSSSFALNMDYFRKQTMKDIEGDQSLVPVAQKEINWGTTRRCDLKNISLSISGYSFDLKMNDITVAAYKINDGDQQRGRTAHVRGEGLLICVVNPLTCKTTMEVVTPTSDISGYRDLLRALDSILPGKIILLASLRDGASYLGQKGRKAFVKMGSLWAPFYLYRDSWLNLFVKGGRTIQDVLIPNMGKLNCSGSPLNFHFDAQQLVPKHTKDCSSWPSSKKWRMRRVFCQTYDGFSNLCDCENPFMFTDGKKKDPNTEEPIPIIIATEKKTRSLFQLLQSLNVQNSRVTTENMILVMDGYQEKAAQLAYILDIKFLIHEPEGYDGSRISRNVRFSLYHGLRRFPNAKTFIFLEDDLILSPDFYSYMKQMEPIFNMDKSIFSVNGFNHLSYPHTSGDPSLTYRVVCYPAYGWMMSREVIEEIIPRWFPANFSHDWDFIIGSDIIRRGRECVIPDVNRSYHWSTQGVHSTASYRSEVLYLSRNLNQKSNVTLQPLQRLIKRNYEKEMNFLLEKSIPVRFEGREDLDEVVTPGKTYAVYVSKEKGPNTDSSFRHFGEEMDIWNVDCRDHFNYTWRFIYNNATVIVVGNPASPYSSYMPLGHPVLQGNYQTDQEILMGETLLRAFTKFQTHYNSTYLPFSSS